MSGRIPDPHAAGLAAQETDLLAAEFVLGTLEPAERETVAREAQTDPVLQDAIAAWERRLAPLCLTAPPALPPASLWQRIEASAWGRMAGAPTLVASNDIAASGRGRSSVRVWQGAAAAGFALAATIAGIAVLHTPSAAPHTMLTALLPLSQPSPSQPSPSQPSAPQPGTAFVVEVRPDGGLRVTPVGAVRVPAGLDLELWLLKNGEHVPKPLGVLPVAGVQLAAGSVPERGGAKILISLEPRGGSPTGLPTGPVLFGGAI